MKTITINKDIANQRVDKFLTRFLNKAGKGTVYKLLRKKHVKLNGGRITPDYILQEGDRLDIFLKDESIANLHQGHEAVDATPLPIIYEDEFILLVDKPAGLLTQPARAGDDSVVARLWGMYPRAAFSPVAINRLDRNTRGLVICAKSLPAAQALSKMLHDRMVDKFYLAMVCGKLENDLRLENYLLKDSKANKARIYEHEVQGSKKVITEVCPIMFHVEQLATLVRLKLVTGRGHQLRASLAHIGHPIMGDVKYGAPKGELRLMAHELHFKEALPPLEHLKNKTFTIHQGEVIICTK